MGERTNGERTLAAERGNLLETKSFHSQVFISPGIGKSVTKLLNDQRIGTIKGRVSDWVESGHYYGALEELVELLAEVLRTPDNSVNVGIVIMVVSIGVLVAFLCIITGKNCFSSHSLRL